MGRKTYTRASSAHSILITVRTNSAAQHKWGNQEERYLPFEFMGAVSRWRIELPQENNQFDIDSVTVPIDEILQQQKNFIYFR